MYFFIGICFVGFLYLNYKFCFINKNITFEDKNNNYSKLISIDIYYKNNILRKKNEINNNIILINDQFDYIIINYLLNNKKYKLIEKNSIFKFPLYKKYDIKKHVFINKITKIEFYSNNKILDLTNALIEFIGPNYDFNYSYNNNVLVKDYLNILKIEYNENDIIKLFDLFGNKYQFNINSILKWEPMLIN